MDLGFGVSGLGRWGFPALGRWRGFGGSAVLGVQGAGLWRSLWLGIWSLLFSVVGVGW